MELEQLIASKMDKIYQNIFISDNVSFERVTDRLRQLKGIDVAVSTDEYKSGNLFIDEKAAIKYWNYDLGTFAFELYSNNLPSGFGWFCPERTDLLTTHYMLIWPRSQDAQLKKLIQIEYMLISKKCLWDILYSLGIKKSNDLIIPMFEMSKNTDEKIRNQIADGICVVYSKNIFPEQPINIVLSKHILEENCILHEVIRY